MLMPLRRTGSRTTPNTTTAAATSTATRMAVSRGLEPKSIFTFYRGAWSRPGPFGPGGSNKTRPTSDLTLWIPRFTLLHELEAGVFGAEGLLADISESHHQLRVVRQRLDADHAPDTELWMADPHSRFQGEAGRLIFVFVG